MLINCRFLFMKTVHCTMTRLATHYMINVYARPVFHCAVSSTYSHWENRKYSSHTTKLQVCIAVTTLHFQHHNTSFFKHMHFTSNGGSWLVVGGLYKANILFYVQPHHQKRVFWHVGACKCETSLKIHYHLGHRVSLK